MIFTSRYDNKLNHMWHSLGASEVGQVSAKQDYASEQGSVNYYQDGTVQQLRFASVTSVGNDYEESAYFGQCGWVGYDWGGVRRKKFLFSDSNVTKMYKHAGHGDAYMPIRDTVSWLEDLRAGDFAGVVCVQGESSLGCQSRDGCKQGRGGLKYASAVLLKCLSVLCGRRGAVGD